MFNVQMPLLDDAEMVELICSTCFAASPFHRPLVDRMAAEGREPACPSCGAADALPAPVEGVPSGAR